MEKRKTLKMSLLQIVVLAVFALMAFGSGSQEFNEGFRAGWNSTAPEEYRY